MMKKLKNLLLLTGSVYKEFKEYKVTGPEKPVYFLA